MPTRPGLAVPPTEGDRGRRGIRTVRPSLIGVRVLRRALRDGEAGSDGAEEWEIAALLGPVYDVGRLGIFFTGRPRHADLLLVTGAGSAGIAGPLAGDIRSHARSRVVVAVGTDAITGAW